MRLHDDFCAFILSHGRSDNVKTFRTLRNSGYTGRIVIVCDDEDVSIGDYRKRFGEENVIVFCKQDEMDSVDTYTNDPPRGVILYARNACFKIAKSIGVRFFVELDDDYSEFEYRWASDGGIKRAAVKNLDQLFEAMVELLDDTKATTISLSQGGDFIGGTNGDFYLRAKRKAMNSFFCDADRPFSFVGALNEDVNTYVSRGIRGQLIFQTMRANLVQGETQQHGGGMSEAYSAAGTFVKSMYSVIANPSCVKLRMMAGGTKTKRSHFRIHHEISWKNCAPKIMRSGAVN